MSGLSIKCVWCNRPLLDAEHAKKHVAEQCKNAPWRQQLNAASVTLAELKEEMFALWNYVAAAYGRGDHSECDGVSIQSCVLVARMSAADQLNLPAATIASRIEEARARAKAKNAQQGGA